jgi:hypothetical protein
MCFEFLTKISSQIYHPKPKMDMQALERGSAMDDGMQRFTATGRP